MEGVGADLIDVRWKINTLDVFAIAEGTCVNELHSLRNDDLRQMAAGKGVGTNRPNAVGDGVAADEIAGEHLQRAELWIEKHTVATGMRTVSTGHVDGFQRTAIAGIAIHNPRIAGDGDGSQRVVAEAITAQGA